MSNAVALVSPTGRSARPAINATMVVAVAPTRVGCSNVHLSMEDIDRIFAWVVVVVEVRRPLPRRARWAIGRSVRPAINAVMDAAVAPTRVGCSSALPWEDIGLICVLVAVEEEWCPHPPLPPVAVLEIGHSARPVPYAETDAAVAPTRVGCSSALPWVDIVLTCVSEAAEAAEEEWCPPPLLPLEEVPHY
jgi:hypothetical protein